MEAGHEDRFTYLSRRVTEEIAAARGTTGTGAAIIHYRLAELYLDEIERLFGAEL